MRPEGYKKLTRPIIVGVMSNYENLVRLRRMIAEFKIYINRTQTYLAPFQLFMIFLIFLNTTVWNVSTIQALFGSKMNFIVAGIIVFVIGVLVMGYIDTRLKILRVEQARYSAPDRNPYVHLYALWTALLLSDKYTDKKRSEKIEKMLEPVLKEAGLHELYLEFKKTNHANL